MCVLHNSCSPRPCFLSFRILYRTKIQPFRRPLIEIRFAPRLSARSASSTPLLANHKSSSSVRRNLPELDSSHLLLECVLLPELDSCHLLLECVLLPELDGCHLEFNLCMYTNVHVCGYGLGTTHREHINQRRRRV